MAASTDSGYGVAITFQSGFCAEILSCDLSIGREPIETTHATSTNGYRTWIPSDLMDPGELTVELNFLVDDNGDTAIAAAAENVTVTWPTPAGGMAGGSYACSGFLTGLDVSTPIDDRMTATATIKFTGDPTWTAST